MYYLLCFLLLAGGGPKYTVSGFFPTLSPAGQTYPHPSPKICQNDECTPLKLDEDWQFEVKLRQGTYQLRYTNLWHQEVTESIDVQSEVHLGFDTDSFRPRDRYPVWEAFKTSRFITIAERSSSGDHVWERLITLGHSKGGIYLELSDPGGKVNARKMLSSLESHQLQDFLQKVDLYHESQGCEDAVLYLMQAGQKTFIIEDKSCELRQLDSILYDLYVSNYVSTEYP